MKIDIIGDIHGCYTELVALTKKLGYEWINGMPIHPRGRKLGFVGDLTDRGPQSLQTIETVFSLVKNGLAHYVPGNHCNKLYRFFLGRNVQITHGLETTVAEYVALPLSEQNLMKKKFIWLYEHAPLYARLDNNRLVIAHAGIRQDYIGKYNQKVKTFVLYGDITGETNPDGTPLRRDWAKYYNGDAWVVYGHTPVRKPRILNRTANIDTGCVFGGTLTALRYPEIETVSVPSTLPYIPEKFKEFN
ncbi:bis(5'-nucleosyl)-tetraphosphatase PrpE [Anoxybacillus rupiensis]|uniref:Bis(5'-nucleosyl)-tetraphosphatase PrpE n=1 Tax=Anoxybacteroides rupiense TaxID=311460 RepID=A0ABT5W5K3_9BACL|nr:bis(5'-nucleosyl)-tetraphosphatase PrpE [Anoxybacillus rupiensis]MDE8564604.1 bis(5'-nucleosyl)-tetraphosphatase PrpE [Anoxybacillus rupiensis]